MSTAQNTPLRIGSFMTADAVKTVNLPLHHRVAIQAYTWSASIRDRTIPTRRSLFGLLLPFALLATQAMAATYTVTNLNNSGAGSLRQAILAANANQRSTIAFGTSGTINLSSPLPDITTQVTIDGSTAPGFAGTPVISVNFNLTPGLTFAVGADSSTIKSLSLVGARNAAITVLASTVTVQGNYIGLLANGAVVGNPGDGVRILEPSRRNLIGSSNPVAGIAYMDTSDFVFQPVSASGTMPRTRDSI